jgi:putative Flp pilus-assembly TadE/G-like protein
VTVSRRTFRGGEEGQVLLALLSLFMALVTAGVVLFQVGRATDLRAGAQTAADAAALAAARELKDQLLAQVLLTGAAGTEAIDEGAIEAAAADYAERNGGRLVSYHRSALDVFVTVETLEALGERARPVGGDRGVAQARARLDPVYTLGVAPPAVGGGSGLSDEELDRLAEAAGVDGVLSNSALRVNGSDCFAGVDVVHLQDAMKIAILRAEAILGGPVVLTDAYRTYECQAFLFNTVTGPVAPPGQSMHNFGLAIDVANYGALASVAAQVGLCQPLPSNDPVHFSPASGPECGGVAGTLGPGGAYGGDATSFVNYEMRLVRYQG